MGEEEKITGFEIGTRRRAFCVFAVTFVVAIGWTGAPAYAQSLNAELSRLGETHSQIEAARKLLEAGKERENEAFGGFLPSAEFLGETGQEHVDNNAPRQGGDNLTERRDKAKISVTQNLFDGFGSSARLEVAEQTSKVLGATLDATTQAVFLEGVTAYLNVFREKRLIEVSQLNERNIQNQLRLEDERVQRGAGITVDVLQAKSRLQIARERRVAFEGRLRTATARYQQVFERSPDIAAMEDARPPEGLLASSLENALSAARGNNPNARISEFTARANDARRDVEKADYYPTVDLVGSAEHEDNTSGIEGARQTLSLFVRGRWEFFSGLKTKSRVAAANRTYEASKSTQRFTLRKVEEEVRIAWENLRTQRQRLALLDNAVNIAEEVLRARRQLREAGKETALNVLDAEGEVFNAQINQIEADYDSRIAVYRVLFATGLLNRRTLGIE